MSDTNMYGRARRARITRARNCTGHGRAPEPRPTPIFESSIFTIAVERSAIPDWDCVRPLWGEENVTTTFLETGVFEHPTMQILVFAIVLRLSTQYGVDRNQKTLSSGVLEGPHNGMCVSRAAVRAKRTVRSGCSLG